jgi:monovalent cation:H+ antiporter-2, CPA2 family
MSPELTHVFTELAIVIGAAAAAALVFQLLRLPLVLGYIVAGLVIGPHVTSAVSDASLVATLSDLGVILLFFTIGLEFSIRTIARVGLPTLLTVIVELSLVILVMYVGGHALGWSSTEAMFVGVGVAIASTMLVVKGLEEHAVTGPAVELILALMVVEDLLSILLLAIMTGVATGSGMSAGALATTLGKLAGLLIAMVVVGLLVVPRAIRMIARFKRDEPLMVASLAICFGTVWVATRAGYSLALGAFVGGMLIAESGKGREVDVLIRPFRDIFAAIFFISIGMTIAPVEIAAHWPAAVFVAVLLVAGKTLGLSLSAFLTGNGLRRAVQAGLSLSQIGEFAFIVVAVGISTGVVRGFLLPVVVGASCITAITGSWQIRASGRFASWVDSHLPKPMQTFVSFYESWIVRLHSTSHPHSIWRVLRRPLVLLVVDTIAVAAIVIVASASHDQIVDRLVDGTGIDPRLAFAIVIGVAAAASGLFAIGIARGAVRLAWVLAAVIIPGRAGSDGDVKVDLGHAPRRALVMTLELAVVLTLGLPLAVIVQPLVPGGGVIVIGVIVVLALATRRSITDFDRHVHAGSALIVEVLSRQGSVHEAPQLAEVSAMLPGFGDLATIVLASNANAIGKTLAELDLRAKTGASVLAITREGGGTANPSPTEPLCAGDVLAMAGSAEAIAAARELLAVLIRS